jgi:hypothetical protein
MDSPFILSGSQIEAMTAEQQVELFNLLILDEGRRLEIPLSGIMTTSAIDLPDEAIDAITEGCPRGGDHISAGDTLWQFKSLLPVGDRFGQQRSTFSHWPKQRMKRSETTHQEFGLACSELTSVQQRPQVRSVWHSSEN